MSDPTTLGPSGLGVPAGPSRAVTETVEREARPVIHLVPHTHWDREWYEPFQTFRMRLVDLIDRLLAQMERDDRVRFTLDGQVATVDDYLEVRPEAEPLVRRLIAEGRLAIGPWQILMDEFLVSGETIVRDLQMGWTRAEDLGGAMPVGYLPDMFGHVAQMPQILTRAGIDRAVVWRGVPAEIGRNRFCWAAPDGSEVTAEYLVGGYGNGAYLFDVPDRLAAKLVAYRAAKAAFYGERSLLAMYGTDHAVPSERLPDLVDAVNRSDGGIEVRIETLAEYAARADDAGDDGRGRAHGDEANERLSRWTGELRSGARANMLMGVTSARIDTKIACGRVERLLERYAEPLAALYGERWPRRLLELAWRRVVDDSAHDSICGCSRDEVVAQVLTRFAEAEQIGQGIVQAASRSIAAAVPFAAWAAVNPSPTSRTDLVELEASVGDREEEVHLLAGGSPLPGQELCRVEPFLARFPLRGDEVAGFLQRRRHGRELLGRTINGLEVDSDGAPPTITLLVDRVAEPPQLDVDELVELAVEAAAAAPDSTWELAVRGSGRRRLLVQVAVPPLGWSLVEHGRRNAGGGPEASADPPALADPPIEHPVSATDRSLSNGLVEVVVDDDGTFGLRGGGVELDRVGRIVDGGDFGDSYNWAPPAEDTLVEAPVAVSVETHADGPLAGELAIRRRYRWPLALEPSGRTRTDATVDTDVLTRLELRAGEPFVRVRIELENRSRDHRVRWHVPLPAPAAASAAEGQYAVVERGLAVEAGHGEVPLPTFPARGFVSAGGVTVLLDHVLEYELVDEGRELALTLLRSIGLISRNDNPYREDPAGPEVAIPAAQLLGPWAIGFALLPHGGTWSEAGVLDAAERYRHPFVLVQGSGRGEEAQSSEGREGHNGHGARDGHDRMPSGLSIDGRGVVMSALRREGDVLELRVVAEHPSATEAIVRGPFSEARRVDLLGRDLGPLAVDGSLRLPLGPWEIATVRLR